MAVINSIMDSWKSTYTVRRVFGDPVEQGEVIVIPVAMVALGVAGIGPSAVIAIVLGWALGRRR